MEEHGTRPACYQKLGSYLLNKSDIIISVWDLNETEALGGTYDVTSLAFRRTPLTSAGNFYLKSNIPVYVIPCKRISYDSPSCQTKSGYLFNLDEKVLTQKQPKALTAKLINLSSLQKEISNYDLESEQLYKPTDHVQNYKSDDAKRIMKYFGVFDFLANRTQQKVNRIHSTLAMLTLLIATSFLIYAKLFPSQYILAGYILLFIFGGCWFKLANPNKLKESYAFFGSFLRVYA
ncbi:hypothetical protein [Psychrosphaera algicola]|uniref:Uncharacterized protein n=1 Tax=Psychrosphaera algicola TaxID=3023714 RepID=A0ABT5FGW1_9GAMM|nr:hypothetical protein [Psychrosphaera sp. G1-22]MDC2890458.1 hypothetical protein [Psychrosphaera sp. G1-22]